VLLALIFAVGFSSPDTSTQLFSTLALVAGIAAACWIGARITRNRDAARQSD
jgi:AAT family amino acid transporter